MRLIEHHGNTELRIVGRKETDEGGEIFAGRVNTMFGFLRSSSLACDCVMLQGGLRCGSFGGYNSFEGLLHQFGSCSADNRTHRLRRISSNDVVVTVLEPVYEHRLHEPSAIGDSAHRHHHLQTCHSDALSHWKLGN